MGRDKASLPWGRSTMLAAVVEVLLSRLPFVVIVAAEGQALPALTDMPDARIAVVADRVPGEGPLRGLEAGLMAAAGHGYGWAVTVATDMPLLTGDVVGTLRDAAAESDGVTGADGVAGADAGATGRAKLPGRGARIDAVVSVAGGRDQPLAAAYRSGLDEEIGALLTSGISSLHGFLDAVAVRRIDLDPASADAVANVNTPGDVERVLRGLGAGSRRNKSSAGE